MFQLKISVDCFVRNFYIRNPDWFQSLGTDQIAGNNDLVWNTWWELYVKVEFDGRSLQKLKKVWSSIRSCDT